ncbi:MAG: hypothetical protein Ta2D_14030 [Rickettsiales bacterium]|nr:MAG: hypothetical protein Ta2D_14030 [Rickettsiales bacterium]
MKKTLGERLIEAAKEAVRFSNGEDTGAIVHKPTEIKKINLSQSK